MLVDSHKFQYAVFQFHEFFHFSNKTSSLTVLSIKSMFSFQVSRDFLPIFFVIDLLFDSIMTREHTLISIVLHLLGLVLRPHL